MTEIEKKILEQPATVLTQEQREFYFENGYLLVEKVVPQEWVDRMIAVTNEFVDRSRSLDKSDSVFDLEPGHTAENPRLRRLSSPPEHHPEYWAYAKESIIADLAGDLVGQDVKYHHSKLNFKWAEGGEEVKWHQDISFWPHTNYSPLTIGTYLYDVGPDQGPLGVVPGSHKGELHSQYNAKGQWTGCLGDEDLANVDMASAKFLTGPAGSVTIHNCRVIHGSAINYSDAGRPLLLNVYSAADACPYTANPLKTRLEGEIVRGKAARWARHDPRPCEMPPDWSDGYVSIYAVQQEEEVDEDQMKLISKQMAGISKDAPPHDADAIVAE